jgi:hypothetical protein
MKLNLRITTLLLLTSLCSSAFAEKTEITGTEMATKVSNIKITDSAGMVTGIYFIYEAVQAFKKNDVGGGLTSGALGLSTTLGAFSIVAEAAETSKEDIKDTLINSPEYLKISNDLGEELAEEFVMDVIAGWSVERLNKKYKLSEDESTVSQTSRNQNKENSTTNESTRSVSNTPSVIKD